MRKDISRRDLLIRSAAMVGAGAVPLLVSTREAEGRQTSAPNDIGNVAWAAKQCYMQAAISDASYTSRVPVGYSNPAVFSQLAAALQYVQNHMADYGISDAAMAQASAAVAGRTLADVNQNWMQYASNAAGLMPTLPNDFFSLLGVGTVLSDMSIVVPKGAPTSMGGLNSAINQVVAQLQRYGARNYAWRREARPHLQLAGYFGQNPANNGTLVAMAAVLGSAGVALLSAAGGTGVLSGTVITTAFFTAMAWSGVGLIVLAVAVIGYVGYRIYTQENGSGSDTPWTKPTDTPSNQWVARWNAGGGTSSPSLQPLVWSSICYPPNC